VLQNATRAQSLDPGYRHRTRRRRRFLRCYVSHATNPKSANRIFFATVFVCGEDADPDFIGLSVAGGGTPSSWLRHSRSWSARSISGLIKFSLISGYQSLFSSALSYGANTVDDGDYTPAARRAREHGQLASQQAVGDRGRIELNNREIERLWIELPWWHPLNRPRCS